MKSLFVLLLTALTVWGAPTTQKFSNIQLTDTPAEATAAGVGSVTFMDGTGLFKKTTLVNLWSAVVLSGAVDTTDITGISTFARTYLDDTTGDATLSTLGGTTAGKAIFTMANPGAIRYARWAADNTATAATPATVWTDITATGLADATIYYDSTAGAYQVRAGTQWVDASPHSPFWDDTFTGVDGTLVDRRLGERGNLQRVIGSGGGNTIVIDNDGNTSFARASTSSTALYLASPTPQSANYSVTVGIKYLTSTGAFLAAAGRFDYAYANGGAGPVGSTGYIGGYSTTDGAWEIYIVSAGSFSLLGTPYTQALVAGTTYACKLEMQGSAISLYVDGVSRVTVTNSVIAGPGRAGMWVANASTRTSGLMADYARAEDGEIAPVMLDNQAWVCQGDSLLGGFPGSYGLTIPQRIAKAVKSSYGWNFGVDGKTMATVVAEDSTTVTPVYTPANRTGNPIALNITGHNDLTAGTSAATIEGYYQTWHTARQTQGYLSVQATIPKSAGIAGAAETQRGLLNTEILNGNSLADVVADPASDPAFSSTSNTVYYHTDGIHWTNTGKQRYAEIIVDAVRAHNARRGTSFARNLSVGMKDPFVQQAPLSVGPGLGKRLAVYDDGTLFNGFFFAPNWVQYCFGGAASPNRFSFMDVANGTEVFTIKETGNIGIGTSAPDKSLEVNLGTSGGVRLSYNDANGSAANYNDFTVSSGGDLTIAPSGADTNVTGRLAVSSSVGIGGGAPILKVLTNTATLDFGSTAAGAVTDLTVTVTGAALGDVVGLGVPHGSTVASGSFSAWVSTTSTVTVRYSNNDLTTARDPASGTFRVMVTQF